MKLTTMCYILRPNPANGQGGREVLMLHRIKKAVDINHGKWIGVGGKFEPGESPEECICREVLEETGLRLHAPSLRALITFNFLDPDPALSDWDTEYMFVFTCDSFSGELTADCPEGELRWVGLTEDQLGSLNQWAGDRLFMGPVLAGDPFFSMKMTYRGDDLLDVTRC